MKRVIAKQLACIVACCFGFNASANAEDQQRRPLQWAGKGVESETRLIKADCGDAQYAISITQKRRARSELTVLERSPEPFSKEVTETLSQLIHDFFHINKVTLSCGAGPADIARIMPNAPHGDEDFTGQLQLEIYGLYSLNTHEAEEKCKAEAGEFEETTWRHVILSPDAISIYPSVIGTCRYQRSE